MDEGESLLAIAEDHFNIYLQYGRSLQSYVQLKSVKRNWETKVYVIWGETGTGKTSFVYSQPHSESIFSYPGRGWFDGYAGQSIVLFDDFRGEKSGLEFDQLLRLLDRYAMQVPVKGGYVNWCPRIVYFTSNIEPMSWYPGDYYAALERRITEIINK